MSNGPGRPTKLTPELQTEIERIVLTGAPVETACEAAGVAVATYYGWMRWGQRGTEPYATFSQAITRARAKAELDLLQRATDGDELGGSGPAKCAQWVLERTRSKRYAARVNVKVEEELESLIDVVERVCEGADCGCVEKILAALAARHSGEEAPVSPSEEVPGVH